MAKIPWDKIKDLAMELSQDLWKSEEKEMRRIIGQVLVAVDGVTERDADLFLVISFSEKFSASKSEQVEDPAQLTLGEKA